MISDEKAKWVKKKLLELQRRIPLDKRIELWWESYGDDLVEQLRLIKENPLPVRLWDVVMATSDAVKQSGDGYAVDDHFAELLVQASSTDPGAFQIANEIAVINLAGGCVLPEPLRIFAANVLLGNAKPPIKAHRPTHNWYRDYLIVQAIEHAEMLGFHATRNEATSEDVVCGVSLAQEALAKVWLKPIVRATVQEIWKARVKLAPTIQRLDCALGTLLQNPDH